MKTIKQLIPKLRANKHTYHNLSKRDISDFKKIFSYIKKNENKEINPIKYKLVMQKLNSKTEPLDYIRKYKAMEILLQ